jgi:hypothetical protein
MSALTAQLQAQLEAVLAKVPEARVVAVRVDTGQGLPQNLRVRGRQFGVRWCESRLALREALVENEGVDDGEGLLLATPIPDTAMPADIAARLVRARVFQARDWEIVRPLFGVSSVDARLGRYEWMAQALIDLSGEGPYHSPPNRFLDLDTAWREFLSRSLGLVGPRPDAMALLEWTLNPEGDARLATLSESVRRDVLAWFEVECGAVGVLVAAAARAGRRMDAVPLATVCGVLFAEGVSPPPELAQAAVRLERYLADRHVTSGEGRAWASEAHRLVEHLGVDRLRPALDRADAFLRELRVSDYARLGVLTPLALEQRLEDFAEALRAHVDRITQESADEVESSAGAVLGHALSAARLQRAERVVMARRLSRWLLQSTHAEAEYAQLVSWQAEQGAFVDWARFRLLGGDEQAELSQAYAALRQAVAARRNALNMAFARAIQDVNRENRWQQGRVLPLERVLETLVAPLMGQHPVLLLVMDGLSLSIFRELMARPEALGWREVVKAETGLAHVGMATLPTVTEGSRASLLCGTLRLGAAPQEKSAFSAHPALQLGSGRKAPLLFHKAELHDDAGLSGALRDALADPTRRLVGVVHNAVDDHLGGPEQLHQSWNLEQLRGLMPLLQAARDARRVVIITADHGHVLEDGSSVTRSAESDRWRPANAEALAEGEFLYQGGRVMSPSGDGRAVCLASEALRYTGRKNGYHGGASLQEMCVPLSVFLPYGLDLQDWIEAPPAVPEWWDLPVMPAAPSVVQPPRPARRKPPSSETQPSLFTGPAEPEPASLQEDWIAALMASSTYQAQRQLAARVALTDESMRGLLIALEERGGRLGWSALAQRMRLPEMRLGGALSAARRVLNVDQSPVLEWDEGSRTISLNRSLLDQQFQLTNRGRA